MGALKKLVVGALILATAYGTFRSSEGIPFIYSRITENGSGICASLVTKIEEGATFYGVVAGGLTINEGVINGVNVSFGLRNEDGGIINGVNTSFASTYLDSLGGGTVNGLEVTLANLPWEALDDSSSNINGLSVSLFSNFDEVNGIQITGTGRSDRMNGVQAAIAGYSDEFYGVQLAGYGVIDKGKNVQSGIVLRNENEDNSHWGSIVTYNNSK